MSDEKQIRDTIQVYFDSMYESDPGKVLDAFHPNAKITGYIEDELHEMTADEFAEFVGEQQPSPKAQGETLLTNVLSVEQSGNIATARVRDDYLGMRFLDCLSLLKVDDRWCIYNKLFHVEGPAA